MSSSYDPSVDRGALRRRAAEIGRRRLGTFAANLGFGMLCGAEAELVNWGRRAALS